MEEKKAKSWFQKRSKKGRLIALNRAIEKKEQLESTIIISHFGGSNNIFTDCIMDSSELYMNMAKSKMLFLIKTWFAMVIADSSTIARWSRDGRAKVCRWIYGVNVCKNQRWAPNIRGVEFQRLGRTIFIKSKMLLFLYNIQIFVKFQWFII